MAHITSQLDLRIQVMAATIVSFLVGSSLSTSVVSDPVYAQIPNSSDGDNNNRVDLTQTTISEFESNNINKSIVALLNFTALNKAEFVSSAVYYGPSHSNIGNPPLLRIQNYDYSGRIIQQFNYWHPLFALEFQEDGKEHLKILPDAVGRFVFSFDPRIASMNISYLHHDGPNSTRAEEVITADLRPTIANFCEQNPDDSDCRSSDLAIIDISTTQGGPQLPILIGDSVDFGVQTTVTNMGPNSPVDAILLTRATIPEGSSGVRVTPAPGTNQSENGEPIIVTSLNERQQHDHTYNIECWEPGKRNIVFESEIAFQSGAVIDANKLNNKGQMSLEVDCVVIGESPRGDPLTGSLQANVTESSSPPTTIEFKAIPNGGTKPQKFRWNFDDDSNANAERGPLTAHQFTRLGQHVVTVTVSDSANGYRGQTTSASIIITIDDKEPPEIESPLHITTQATDSNGTNVAFPVSAIDKVDGPVPVFCSPSSSNILPVGDTIITCSASDAAGNSARKPSTVTVNTPVCPVENQDYDPIKGCIPYPNNCGDDSDNDNDVYIDSNDPDCTIVNTVSLPCPENQRYDSSQQVCVVDQSNCYDESDNDGDGLIDSNDPDCTIVNTVSLPCPENYRYDSTEFVCVPEPAFCSDGLDNDNDGLVDGNDIDCPAPYILSFEISCDQGQEAIDINRDGVADECQPI